MLESGDTKGVVVADLDGDGRKEIVTSTENGDNYIWQKGSDGLYQASDINILTYGALDIRAEDVNGDGCVDLIVIDSSGEEVRFINDCAGNFSIE